MFPSSENNKVGSLRKKQTVHFLALSGFQTQMNRKNDFHKSLKPTATRFARVSCEKLEQYFQISNQRSTFIQVIAKRLSFHWVTFCPNCLLRSHSHVSEHMTMDVTALFRHVFSIILHYIASHSFWNLLSFISAWSIGWTAQFLYCFKSEKCCSATCVTY